MFINFNQIICFGNKKYKCGLVNKKFAIHVSDLISDKEKLIKLPNFSYQVDLSYFHTNFEKKFDHLVMFIKLVKV